MNGYILTSFCTRITYEIVVNNLKLKKFINSIKNVIMCATLKNARISEDEDGGDEVEVGHNVPGKDETGTRDVSSSGLLVANHQQPHVGKNSNRAANSLCK